MSAESVFSGKNEKDTTAIAETKGYYLSQNEVDIIKKPPFLENLNSKENTQYILSEISGISESFFLEKKRGIKYCESTHDIVGNN